VRRADLGRFIREDPIQDGANWYLFTKNDPINQHDRSGLSPNIHPLLTGAGNLLGRTVAGLSNSLPTAGQVLGAGASAAYSSLAATHAPLRISDFTSYHDTSSLQFEPIDYTRPQLSPQAIAFQEYQLDQARQAMNRAHGLELVDIAQRQVKRSVTFVDNVDTASGLTPGVSDARDLAEFTSGYDLRTRQPLSTGQRILTGIGVALPVVGGVILRRFLTGGQAVVDAGRNSDIVVPGGSVYDVAPANNLRKNPVRGTQSHHAPQSREAELLIGDFNARNRVGNEPAIRLPISEHAAVSAAQRARGAQASARDLLADEIRILKNNTSAPNAALQKLIDLNRRIHPTDYLPLHRTSP